MRFIGLFVLLFGLSLGSVLNLVKFSPQNASLSGAVCNDGSPAAYYFLPGNTSKWLVYFQGGALCFDPISCGFPRNGSGLTSSVNYPPTAPNAIPDHPMFAGWNRVQIMYCSSDLYVGQKRTPSYFGFTFAGFLIVQAIFEDLITNHGLNNNSEIILWGDSAGALGVILNIDYVASILPGARLQGVPNSGWFLNHTLFSVFGISVDQVNAITIGLYQARINPICLAARGASGLCDYIPVLYPFLQQKMFWIQSFIDAYEISVQLGLNNLTTPYSEAFIEDVGNTYKNALSVLQTKPGDGWYLLTCYLHVPSTTIPFINSTDAVDTVVNWYFGLNGPTRLIDRCNIHNATLMQFLNPGIACYNVSNTCLQDPLGLPTIATVSATSASPTSQTGATGSQTGATASQTGATASQTGATGSQTGATASQTGATASQTGATASQTGTAASTQASANSGYILDFKGGLIAATMIAMMLW